MDSDLEEFRVVDVWTDLKTVEGYDENLKWGLWPSVEPEGKEFKNIAEDSIDPASDYDLYITGMTNPYFNSVMPSISDYDDYDDYKKRCLERSLEAARIIIELDYYIYLDTLEDNDHQLVLTKVPREELNKKQDVTEGELIPEDLTDLLFEPKDTDFNSNIVAKYI